MGQNSIFKLHVHNFISVVVAALFFASLGQAQSDDSYTITEVQIVGNDRIDDEALKLQLPKHAGSFNAKDISEGIKAIYRTGFFDDVTGKIEEKDGKRVLVFTVVERATVRKIFIRGNKDLSESELAKVLTFDNKRFFDRTKIQGLIRAAKAYYQSKGYYDAEIEYSVVPSGTNQVDITFSISEGPRYKITQINFVGLHTIDKDDLLGVMSTTTYKWWSSWLLGSGRLSQDQLENDKQLIRQYFVDHGYLDATLSDSVVEKVNQGEIAIRFDVSEGTQYKIGAITASGTLLPPQDGESGEMRTVADLSSKVDEVFSAAKVRKDSFTISDRFGDLGHPFANVVPGTDLNREKGTVAVNFEVNQGPIATINRITIRGNTKTYDHVIRREILVREQDKYSGTKVRRSEELLRRLGYFDEVSVVPKPSEKKDEVDLDVNVREGSTGSFSVGAGYSTSDGALFNTKLAENNLWGTGRKAELNLDLGTQASNAIISLDDPRFNDTYMSLGTDAFVTKREYNDFDRGMVGGGVTAGYPLEQVFGEALQDISASLKYEYAGIDINRVNDESAAPLVLASVGKSTSSAITPRISRNTINNPLNPTSGSRQSFSTEIAGLGGDSEYYLFEARSSSFVPVWRWDEARELTFAHRIVLGWGETYNDQPFPLFKRYFPGGINSVRGYDARSLGPKDAQGNEYGGSKELVNNFELLFPLVTSAGLKGVLFYDIGQAYDDGDSIAVDQLKQGYGFGIRWNSPMGPIRIELGFPASSGEGEKSMVPMFSFGSPM